ncbi:peptidase [Citrobacter amalonaticus]|uniref:Peptidase n=1 Tax=Citrobacter amalonaticus TaxID=35703 RepID=A0ABY0HY35_CITAM|nr:peptidase [Citrobacter sp. CFNIH10]AVC45169.1 peptidase [Citrobacter amalonaticus]RSB14646.1 peptidase [Citrobacter farmeri]AVI00391.1 peptidase [Citrobacter amalonaticus]EGT4254004.1 peptidase [Citrobacter amalonaticus]
MNLLYLKLPMNALNTQNICGFDCFLTDDYPLHRSGQRDHILLQKLCRNLDHFKCGKLLLNYYFVK